MCEITWRVVYDDGNGTCKETLVTVVGETAGAATLQYLEILKTLGVCIKTSELLTIGDTENVVIQS